MSIEASAPRSARHAALAPKRRFARFVLAAAVPLIALVAACQQLEGEPSDLVDYQLSLVAESDLEALAVVQPSDVFVVPVLDQTSSFGAPAAALRTALYRGLVDRLYSPLQLGWADALVAELESSAGPPTVSEANAVLGADAFLEVRLLTWDESVLESEGVVLARLEARLVDPARPDQPLWGFGLGRRVDVGGPSSRRATHEVLVSRAVESLVADLLALLPTRDARRAPR